jgi:hypothetical protein
LGCQWLHFENRQTRITNEGNGSKQFAVNISSLLETSSIAVRQRLWIHLVSSAVLEEKIIGQIGQENQTGVLPNGGIPA